MIVTPEITLILMVAASGFAFVVMILLMMVARAAGRAAQATVPLTNQMEYLNQRVQTIGDGQQQLAGGLTQVSEAQAVQQSNMLKLMEARLAAVQEQMTLNLTTNAKTTANSLGELQQRLVTIDKAQENIQKLSGDVLSLQDILANKQTRGAFGEIQLQEIVSKALPSDAYTWQATLSKNSLATYSAYKIFWPISRHVALLAKSNCKRSSAKRCRRTPMLGKPPYPMASVPIA